MDANALGTLFIVGGAVALTVALLLPLVAMIRGLAEAQPQRTPVDS